MAEPIILTNNTGVEVHVLRIGAVIQRLLVPTKDGSSKVDVVLGFEDASAYKVWILACFVSAIALLARSEQPRLSKCTSWENEI